MALVVESTLILIVEDDATLRELYRTALASVGYSTMAVDDGMAALRLVDANIKPDAVILDLELPRVRGRDVYEELQAHAETSNIPIIIVTGSDTSDIDPKKFACILKKPASIDTLLDAVVDCLRRKQDAGYTHSFDGPAGDNVEHRRGDEQ